MSYKVDPLRCAFVSGLAVATPLSDGFVSLYNNDNLGRVFAVHDVGRVLSGGGFRGYSVLRGQIGSGAVTPSPVVAGEPTPPGQLTSGASASPDAITLLNGTQTATPYWTHEYPFVVLRGGYRLTAWASIVNQNFDFGFWYQVLQTTELMGLEPAPTLVIPKVITLTLETE